MLPSPIIEGTLPAFYVDKGIANIRIPFFMSRAVNKNQIRGFVIKIKNLQNSEYIKTLRSEEVDYNSSIVYFYMNKEELSAFKIGGFYKIQMAYIENNPELTQGYYSTVGIIKYTTKPEVFIEGLNQGYNVHKYAYTGVYSQKNGDATEKEYSYRFLLTDENGSVIQDTGYLIHNSINDMEYYESQDTITFPEDLEENKKYYLSYSVKTNNGLEIATEIYKINAKTLIPSSLNVSLKAELNYENGYIQISIENNKKENGVEIPVRGAFVLCRATEKGEYKDWKEITKFTLSSQRASQKLVKDFSIEQGIKYKYSIQQFNDKIYSDRILTDEIYADFEHCYLYDGNRQLKIKFNPKISSFKKDLFEAKVDTLGSKFPFFFKNGQVEYKEFSISGLISYLSDEEGLFFNNKEMFESLSRKNNLHNILNQIQTLPSEETYYRNYLTYFVKITEIVMEDNGKEKKIIYFIPWVNFIQKYHPSANYLSWDEVFDIVRKQFNFGYLYENQEKQKKREFNFATTDLASYNVQKEREFKIEVLDWLTNGEPKLFKSPTEGNYLIRLLNVSLSPEAVLGGTLHNFSATAYEVGDISYEDLSNFGIINTQNYNNKILKIMSVPLYTEDENLYKLNPSIYTTEITNANGVKGWYATGKLNNNNVQIEAFQLYDMEPGTLLNIKQGSYTEEIMIGVTGFYSSQNPVDQLQLKEGYLSKGILTYSFFTTFDTSFNYITGLETEEKVGHQFIGSHQNIIQEIEDVQRIISNIYSMKAYKRQLKECFIQDEYQKVTDVVIDRNNYKNYFIKSTKGTYVTPSYYNSRYEYYRKVRIFYDIFTQNPFLIYSLINYEDKKIIESSAGFSLLDLYAYESSEDIDLGILYKEVTFKDISQQDILNNYSRSLKNRTSTNPCLYDYRDFELMVKAEQLYYYDNKKDNFLKEKDLKPDSAKTYFIIKDIKNIIALESEEKYLNKESYEDFKLLISFLESKNSKLGENISNKLTNNFKICAYDLVIDDNEIDLEQSEYCNFESPGKIKNFSTSIGVYCELFYQVQIISYDLSNQGFLQEYLEDLNLVKQQLKSSPRDSNNENEYIKKIQKARSDYKNKYRTYVENLQAYLDLLNTAES